MEDKTEKSDKTDVDDEVRNIEEKAGATVGADNQTDKSTNHSKTTKTSSYFPKGFLFLKIQL